ncbi:MULTISPECIES: RIP metalloprotease RseP [unclassified Oceanobacter]|uniref:RIP metalloprotease RseP n=2 Tax=Gammaproteobacteria TaxID=1236 RepID=UPI0026E13D49|nr:MULTISPECIES: RIP metalloprotease RseP [unclassified Oceanobacter]MDO6682816.1 RIP metalloprotease RseP [Oceanobacter sp. 5_MG-2023]MDP2504888.1 RIP metalloprotease RseP [Oceanobacter sp. 3_MG-2023]MDP2546332.1 RIP metalloprotease RseP [Oceanobacter sp. 4_MG-2023]MDP2607633.1 RIP metalloprotease RseP [Oceanobacter sp. 1_MG-2023]MDP2610901.1 RIP metalloprotease RseP [Oceanobacter sp. 2_MG-2023]
MTILWFIVAISLLVVIHEYGHFWAARRCGVRVLRFSVGFGNPLFSVRDKQGTEYSVAPLPLGGYVKMLDEREGDVPEHLREQSFNAKSVAQRNFIAAAGPFANFLFAILAYWVLFMVGTTGVIAEIGQVQSASPAAIAGIEPRDRIVAVDGHETTTWEDVNWRLISHLGESGHIDLTLEDHNRIQRPVQITIDNWLSDSEQPDPMGSLGLQPRQLDVPAMIGSVVEGSAAEQAGFLPGDQVMTVDGQKVEDWFAWVDLVQRHAGVALQVDVLRDGNMTLLTLVPGSRTLDDGRTMGFAGVGTIQPEVPPEWLSTSSADPLSAMVRAAGKTWDLITFTLDSMWKMLAGDLSVKNLSGPITIAKVAGTSASGGLESFVQFLALLSVSLGVLNLLPVPMLDGGHILFNSAESVIGKPLPERVQTVAMQVGIVMLFSLMAVAFYNDIGRL